MKLEPNSPVLSLWRHSCSSAGVRAAPGCGHYGHLIGCIRRTGGLLLVVVVVALHPPHTVSTCSLQRCRHGCSTEQPQQLRQVARSCRRTSSSTCPSTDEQTVRCLCPTTHGDCMRPASCTVHQLLVRTDETSGSASARPWQQLQSLRAVRRLLRMRLRVWAALEGVMDVASDDGRTSGFRTDVITRIWALVNRDISGSL